MHPCVLILACEPIRMLASTVLPAGVNDVSGTEVRDIPIDTWGSLHRTHCTAVVLCTGQARPNARSHRHVASEEKATPTESESEDTKPASSDAEDVAPGARSGGERGKPKGDSPDKKDKTAYDYELPGSDGKEVPLASFKGKTLFIVNLARNSSYNSQLAGLQKLSDPYKDKGLVVLGVPSNDFGAAEPGTDTEIQKAYKSDAKITFPLMAKSPLTGEMELPFYLFLTTGKTAPEPGPVHWNYTKFIIDKTGKAVVRLGSDVAPDSPEMLSTLDQILDGTYKPKKVGGEGSGGGGGGGEPPR